MLNDKRILQSSLADFAYHKEKLSEILIRFTEAFIISDKASPGSGCDLGPADLFNGFVFKENQIYLMKSGTFTVDTANNKNLSFENNSTLCALPGEEVRIIGTDSKSPILIEGKFFDVGDFETIDTPGGTKNPGQSSKFIRITSAGLNTIQANNDINDNTKNVFFMGKSGSVLVTGDTYTPKFKQVNNDTDFEVFQDIRTPPLGPALLPNKTDFAYIIIPVYNVTILNIAVNFSAFGFLDCSFDVKGEYNDIFDSRLLDLFLGSQSVLNYVFKPNPSVVKKEVTTNNFQLWTAPLNADNPKAIFNHDLLTQCNLSWTNNELIIEKTITDDTSFNNRALHACLLKIINNRCRLRVRI